MCAANMEVFHGGNMQKPKGQFRKGRLAFFVLPRSVSSFAWPGANGSGNSYFRNRQRERLKNINKSD